jgi:hypothetical protein
VVVIPAEAIAEPIVAGGPLAGSRPRIVMIEGKVVSEA